LTAVEATAGAAWVTWRSRGFSPAAGNAWKPGAALGLLGSSGSLACLYRGQQAGWQAGWERPESRWAQVFCKAAESRTRTHLRRAV